MDNHIPKKTIKGKVDVPWMTNKVKRLINGVIKCVKRLNPKKASGPDKMPILALQENN